MIATSTPSVCPPRRRLAAVRFAVVTCSLVLTLSALALPALAGVGGTHGPIIAMGDSIPYGYDPNLAAIGDFAGMRGYPELLAGRGRRPIANLSCPGQTAQAMLSADAPDFLCPFFLAAGGPLHWSYTGTQIEAAEAFLTEHPDTGLVTITAGGNDVFRCTTLAPDQVQPCIDASYPAVRAALVTTIDRLRSAGYHGPVVLTTYYPFPAPLDTTDHLRFPLRQVAFEVAAVTGARVADAWTLFEQAARRAGGDVCQAGLVIELADGTCDLHPSPAGDRLLARAVQLALAGGPSH